MSNQELIKQIQSKLNDLGYDAGSVDGILGSKTTSEIIKFQVKSKLPPNGVITDKLLKKLSIIDNLSEPVWLSEARRMLGIHEGKDRKTVLNWAKYLNLSYYNNTDIPWCGLFVAYCISSTLKSEPLPDNTLLARNWLKYGEKCDPKLGAVLVFWRGSPSATSGHVGFYIGEDKEAYHVLGGNQSDSVTITRIKKNRLLGARWAKNSDQKNFDVVQLDSKGKLSSNEA